MKNDNKQASKESTTKLPRYTLIFPLTVLVIYSVLFLVTPDRAMAALNNSLNVGWNILLPMVMVFVVMLLLNLFVKPSRVVRLLGTGLNIKGILLSVFAGILSTGPIYVWYPLLKDLREKGAGNMPVAIFLYNRAVKPFLLPVIVGYFGWVFVAILTVLTILASIANGYLVARFTRN